MISILILTRNEQDNITACIDSVSWSDDIHVFDSYSTDQTVEIAKARGAKVTQRHFDNWASHQNWALANLPFTHPWVFYIDADERMTPGLRGSILTAVELLAGHAVAPVSFRVRRRDFFMGRWLKHVQATSYYQRLFRPECMRYERLVNPVSIANGPVGQVEGYLDHFPFTKGVSHWVERHNHYSTFEAQQIIQNRKEGRRFSVSAAFFGKDFHERRYHQKELLYRLPLRPVVKFLLLYFARLGFLDGRPGFTYCVLQSIYEYLIVLKTREILRGGPDVGTVEPGA